MKVPHTLQHRYRAIIPRKRCACRVPGFGDPNDNYKNHYFVSAGNSTQQELDVIEGEWNGRMLEVMSADL